MVETAGEASTLPASVAVPGAGEAAAAVHEADETAMEVAVEAGEAAVEAAGPEAAMVVEADRDVWGELSSEPFLRCISHAMYDYGFTSPNVSLTPLEQNDMVVDAYLVIGR